MRAVVAAALLPGHEPHRGGLLEGEGDLEKSPSPNPRNAHRSHGTGAGGGGPFGRPRLLRTPRVPHCYGSTVLTNALGSLHGRERSSTPLATIPAMCGSGNGTLVQFHESKLMPALKG